MKLSQIVGELSEADSTWKVRVLSRRHWDGSKSTEILEYPVFGVSFDEEALEIDLLTDEGASAPRTEEQGLSVGQLLSELRTLEGATAEFPVFSASAEVSVDDYDVRKDVPVIGVAVNAEDEVFGLLQWPPEQWDERA